MIGKNDIQSKHGGKINILSRITYSLFMMIILFTILLSLIAHQTTAMKQETITSGWHKFVVDEVLSDGLHYEIYASEDTKDQDSGGTLFIKQNATTFLISIGHCETKGIYTFCFENKTFEGEYVTRSSGLHVLPGLKYSIIKEDLDSQLDVRKELSTTKPFLNEEVDLTTTIKNTGSSTANNVFLEEIIPKGFIVKNFDNAFTNQIGKLTTKIHSIPAGGEWKASYTIIPKNVVPEVTQRSVSRIKFTPEMVDQEVDKVFYKELSVKQPVSITKKLSSTKVQRTSDASYSIIVDNHEKIDLPVSIEIVVPKKLLVKNYNNFSRNNQTFSFEGMVKGNDKLTLTINFTTPFLGDYNIKSEGSVAINDIIIPFEDNKTITVFSKGLSCSLDCEPKSVVYIGEEVVCNLSLYNPDEAPYRYFTGVMSTPTKKIKLGLHFIGPHKKKSLHSERFKTDSLKEGKKYSVNFNANYSTSEGELFYCSGKEEFTMKNKNKKAFLSEDKKEKTKNNSFIEKIKQLLRRIFG